MSIPTDAEKVFDEIQYPFTIENLSGQEIEITLSSVCKGIYLIPAANIKLKDSMFSFYHQENGEMFSLTAAIHYSLITDLKQYNKQKKAMTYRLRRKN